MRTNLIQYIIQNDVIITRGITTNAETKVKIEEETQDKKNWQLKDVSNPITSNLDPSKHLIWINR